MIFPSLIILGGAPVFAGPPPPTPVCYVKGTIKSVEFKDAYNEPCVNEPYGCPRDMEVSHPAGYFLNIDVTSVTYVSGTTHYDTCEKMYPIDRERTIFINKDQVRPRDTFVVNQEIEGTVRRSLFESYSLKATQLPMKTAGLRGEHNMAEHTVLKRLDMSSPEALNCLVALAALELSRDGATTIESPRGGSAKITASGTSAMMTFHNYVTSEVSLNGAVEVNLQVIKEGIFYATFRDMRATELYSRGRTHYYKGTISCRTPPGWR